ncbi:DUF6349 family protein [Planomonospora corallina]|uniref:DUF6349 family protein n=1 Tax=Planomonospora corallina TaxID=1806052 RepID=A0ABV8I7L9_9ACTN
MTSDQRPPGDDCRASVRSWLTQPGEPAPPTVAHPDRPGRYRATCPACGHKGPVRSSANEAVEDGCDHAYPGWRELPVVVPRPFKETHRPRWEADCRAAYPPGWFDREGPVREYRGGGGMRHVPGLAPGGGYCMAVAGGCRPAAPPAPDQPALF